MQNTPLNKVESFIKEERNHCRNEYCEEDVTFQTKNLFEIKPYRYVKRPLIVFSKPLINYLLKVRRRFILRAGYNKCGGSVEQDTPIVFLLGQKGNKICAAELIPTYGGCGQMCDIETDDLNESMYKLIQRGYQPAGIARIGMFSKGMGSFGNAFYNLGEFLQEQGMCFLSIGRTQLFVHYTNHQKKFRPTTNYAIR